MSWISFTKAIAFYDVSGGAVREPPYTGLVTLEVLQGFPGGNAKVSE
jgi:hypothetical protein